MTREATEAARMHLKFDLKAMRRAAGDKMFARGEAYCDQGQVEVLGLDEGRVLGNAIGGGVYRVELKRRAVGFEGFCTCPAYAEWAICKHMIGLALAAEAAEPEELELAQSRLVAIRTYLLGRSVEELAELLIGAAVIEPELWGDLEIAAEMDEAQRAG